MNNTQERLDALEQKVQSIDEKLDSVLELVQMGRGIMMLAKVGAWCVGAALTVVELWRQFVGTKP